MEVVKIFLKSERILERKTKQKETENRILMVGTLRIGEKFNQNEEVCELNKIKQNEKTDKL